MWGPSNVQRELEQIKAQGVHIISLCREILQKLENQGKPVGIKLSIGVPTHNQGGEPMSSPYPLGDDQNVNVTVPSPLQFVDDVGNPAPAPTSSDGSAATPSVAYSTDQPTMLAITPDATGYVPNVKALGPEGIANLVITVSFAVQTGTAPANMVQNVPFQISATAAVGLGGVSIGAPVHN